MKGKTRQSNLIIEEFDNNTNPYPNTIQNGKISNNTEALIGKCFSSRVIASEAKEKARLSNIN
ncbi:CLUMA_CG012331, isoform A [Clunio marinus]|uniref:CLUMA_CG012331, isoform A n=1 Tax=Clunio marinus TaxID=568069 RepID=A0A1J1IKN0_9DIPT|nr:CLUMA_CG012331, isoform A [Clunio marinus]